LAEVSGLLAHGGQVRSELTNINLAQADLANKATRADLRARVPSHMHAACIFGDPPRAT
jgi:hypothetical protein